MNEEDLKKVLSILHKDGVIDITKYPGEDLNNLLERVNAPSLHDLFGVKPKLIINAEYCKTIQDFRELCTELIEMNLYSKIKDEFLFEISEELKDAYFSNYSPYGISQFHKYRTIDGANVRVVDRIDKQKVKERIQDRINYLLSRNGTQVYNRIRDSCVQELNYILGDLEWNSEIYREIGLT